MNAKRYLKGIAISLLGNSEHLLSTKATKLSGHFMSQIRPHGLTLHSCFSILQKSSSFKCNSSLFETKRSNKCSQVTRN